MAKLFSWSGNNGLFLHSFVPLKSLSTETYTSAGLSIAIRLRSQNSLGPKMTSVMSRKLCLILLPPEISDSLTKHRLLTLLMIPSSLLECPTY